MKKCAWNIFFAHTHTTKSKCRELSSEFLDKKQEWWKRKNAGDFNQGSPLLCCCCCCWCCCWCGSSRNRRIANEAKQQRKMVHNEENYVCVTSFLNFHINTHTHTHTLIHLPSSSFWTSIRPLNIEASMLSAVNEGNEGFL